MRVPILTYHQVTPAPDPSYRKYAIRPTVFAAQMRWIAENGFVPVQLEHLFATPAPNLPAKPIVITFDDGFQDCVDHALPILQARGFTATFFLVAGLVGKTSRWLIHERGLEYPLMDWTAVRTLVDAGFECGAHSMTHPRLATLPSDVCLRELQDSRAMLEDRLGRAVRHVAYPFGSFSDSVRQITAVCGYVSGCTVEAGVASTTDDPLALKRLHVSGADGTLGFTNHVQTKPSAGKSLQTRARSLWRRFLTPK